MGVFTLAMINVSAIVSLRGMPAESTYGLSSVFYYIFAAVFFLVPVSLVAAELTTGWPQKGGVYRWVGEAFGKKWGFLAIWLQWIESTIWFPTVLTFAAVSLAFMGPGQRWDEALAANKWYVLIVVLCVYWAATLLNLRGMKTSAGVTKWGTIIGTIIPGAILILLGLGYWAGGNPILLDMSWDKLVPDMSRILPDMVKKELPGSGAVTADQAAALVQETCRAELVHGASCLLGLAFLWLWPGWGGAIVLAVWVLLANLPFILIQRYNRPRLMRLAALLRKRAQRKGEQNARTDPDL